MGIRAIWRASVLPHASLRRRLQVLQARRIELHAVLDAVHRDVGLTVATPAEVYIGQLVNVVRRIIKQSLLDPLAITLAPKFDKITHVVLPQFEGQCVIAPVLNRSRILDKCGDEHR